MSERKYRQHGYQDDDRETVERHIANLAAKVGVEGRSELVAFAASHPVGAR